MNEVVLKLNLFERKELQRVLPTEAGYANQRVFSNYFRKLAVTQDEIDAFRKTDSGALDNAVIAESFREFDFSDLGLKLLRKTLKKLDEDEKITMWLVSPYEQLFKDELEAIREGK